MAKIKHNNFLDTVNDVFNVAIDEGVLHLYAEGDTFTGRIISMKKYAYIQTADNYTLELMGLLESR